MMVVRAGVARVAVAAVGGSSRRCSASWWMVAGTGVAGVAGGVGAVVGWSGAHKPSQLLFNPLPVIVGVRAGFTLLILLLSRRFVVVVVAVGVVTLPFIVSAVNVRAAAPVLEWTHSSLVAPHV